ncbi:MAG: hypothetical protein HQK65_15645 [Desulfamplus sp.]|nr:hypothetical protein [Desulfamplus sp.]
MGSAFQLGWRKIKLYFMNGLPTETLEDIEAISGMALKLASFKSSQRSRASGKGVSQGQLKINVSFATFIPKAHTPFQRCAQIPPEQARENLDFLKKQLRHPGINLKWQNPWTDHHLLSSDVVKLKTGQGC